MIPSDQQIIDMIRDLRRSPKHYDELEKFALRMARECRQGTPGDGYKANHGAPGFGGGGMVIEGDTVRASSVEAAALNDSQPDEIHEQAMLLFDMLNQAASSIRAVKNTERRIRDRQTWEKPIGHQATPCKSEVNGCEKPAVARGFCDSCRKWIDRHPSGDGLDPITVPAEVIAERTKRRAKAS